MFVNIATYYKRIADVKAGQDKDLKLELKFKLTYKYFRDSVFFKLPKKLGLRKNCFKANEFFLLPAYMARRWNKAAS